MGGTESDPPPLSQNFVAAPLALGLEGPTKKSCNFAVLGVNCHFGAKNVLLEQKRTRKATDWGSGIE